MRVCVCGLEEEKIYKRSNCHVFALISHLLSCETERGSNKKALVYTGVTEVPFLSLFVLGVTVGCWSIVVCVLWQVGTSWKRVSLRTSWTIFTQFSVATACAWLSLRQWKFWWLIFHPCSRWMRINSAHVDCFYLALSALEESCCALVTCRTNKWLNLLWCVFAYIHRSGVRTVQFGCYKAGAM